MTIKEILSSSNKNIKSNIELLAEDYKEKTGRKVCRTCPSDVQLMLLTLKNYYNMTKFKFTRHAAMYKNKKGDKTTISNATMTDERAIEFLKTNPERIDLFCEYPSNWKQLIGGKVETAEEKENRLAIEAELNAKKEAEELKAKTLKTKPVKKDLENMKLADLRKAFPMVKDASIKGFIAKVMKLPVEAPKVDTEKVDTEKVDTEKVDTEKVDTEKVDTEKVEGQKSEAEIAEEGTAAAEQAAAEGNKE